MTLATEKPAAAAHAGTATDIDIEALRQRYRTERDKRLRAEGNEQYVEVKGDFSHYADDPYVEPGFTREALTDEVEVVIIGGGFGGLMAGARLREAGHQNIRMIEAAGDFGGTWYWNRYPGAACDIEAYVYLPLLEEMGVIPSHRFADGPDILAHAQRIGRHFGLYRDALFQTRVTGLEWNEAEATWTISTHRGDRMRARFVIMSNGPLNRPKLPGIAGIDSFKGHTFHTSRWDYAYTGGSPGGQLARLRDKRVAVIGTGATAVQCVPHLAESAQQLYVFQRTPSSIDVRNDRPTDPAWAQSLKPGWHQERMENFASQLSGAGTAVDLVMDGWTEAARSFREIAMNDRSVLGSPEKISAAWELADARKMMQVRARVDSVVNDPATAESLKPWYRQFCKRPCFHDDYLLAFNRPSVKLIDTQGRGVERFTENAVVANGVAYEVNAVIFATGFEVGTGYTRRSGYDLKGRNGLSLTDKWRNGMRTVHGMLSNGFPNLIIFGTPQSGQVANFVHALDEQGRHASYLIQQAQARKVRTLEPTVEEEDAWVKTIIESTRRNQAFLESCTPGYYNNEGKPGALGVQNSPYGLGGMAFFKLLKAWRDNDKFSGLELTYLPA